jgi:hypothetical protein
MNGTTVRRGDKRGAAPSWFKFLLAYFALLFTVACTFAVIILISKFSID